MFIKLCEVSRDCRFNPSVAECTFTPVLKWTDCIFVEYLSGICFKKYICSVLIKTKFGYVAVGHKHILKKAEIF